MNYDVQNKKLHEIKIKEDKLKFEKDMNLMNQKHFEEMKQ